jgi:glycosyltransferase involved in cell wall biosynthesis
MPASIPSLHICKIASLYDHRWRGGAERQLALQVAGFVAQGHRVDVITLAEPGEAARSYVDAHGARVHRLPLRNLYFPFGNGHPPALQRAAWHALDVHNPAMAEAVARTLRAIKPDLVVTHKLQGLSASIWRASIDQGICTVHALHDHELVCPATAMTRGDRLCETPCTTCSGLSRLRRTLSARPFAVVGPSHSILERHRRFGWFGDVPRSAVLTNALPPDWPPAPTERRCGTPLRVGYMGRLEAAKGIDTLLDAAARLAPGRIALHIAGEGDAEYVAALRARHPTRADVHWLGPCAAREFHAGIDLLVVPSRAHESFCNVVMEGASLGVPAIVSDRGALPERIGNGRYGWCFPAGDVGALASLLSACADDPQRVAETGMAAIETRREHAPANTVRHYAEQLAQWCDEHRALRAA